MALRACVLAAGKGTRMGGDRAKVLAEAGGRPLIGWVLDALAAAGVGDIVAVVGFMKEAVIAALPTGVRWVEQSPQLGTGHAVMCARSVLTEAPAGATAPSSTPVAGPDDPVLVALGDMPLIRPETFRSIIDLRAKSDAAGALLTVRIPPASRFGRVIRDGTGAVQRIVEAKDATPEELAVTEGNSGVMCFRPDALWAALDEVGNDNAQGEYYLTDVIEILIRKGERMEAYVCEDDQEALGVNTPDDLARVETALKARGAI